MGHGAGGVFDGAAELVSARLRQGPGAAAQQELAPTAAGPPPSRWTLRTIRATLPELHGYSLSGVWRVLRRLGLKLRTARVQQFSPDPDYGPKVAHLMACLHAAAVAPERVVAIFLDEMGYQRWPEPGPEWMPRAPTPPLAADRAQAANRLWRLIGGLNALTGQVDALDNYIVGRKQVSAFYRHLDAAYPAAERIYVVQDNWSIHGHADVLATLATLPRIEPVWLPTYAPWLNPIEKLWGWLRADVLTGHRLAGDWVALRDRVNAFLAQFGEGSAEVLHRVGLQGDGRLAQALRPP